MAISKLMILQALCGFATVALLDLPTPALALSCKFTNSDTNVVIPSSCATLASGAPCTSKMSCLHGYMKAEGTATLSCNATGGAAYARTAAASSYTTTYSLAPETGVNDSPRALSSPILMAGQNMKIGEVRTHTQYAGARIMAV